MKNLFFFVGTKAQAIKCLPLIRSAVRENYNVFIVDSGQHVEIVNSILSEFKDTVTRLNLFKNYRNISQFKDAVSWIINFVTKHLLKKTLNTKGICIVHGDTLTTLLGLIWAKRNNLNTLHLESGLTSSKLFNPFPEELIRRFVSRFSDILICFDIKSENYLISKFGNTKKYIKKVSENTIIETINDERVDVVEGLITVTLHRTENIINKKKLQDFVNFLSNLSSSFNINWYIHEPTMYYLDKYNINNLDKLNLHELIDHEDFISEIKKSEIVITDGGSIQEECFFLGKKTLIWRKATERDYALNNNMFITNFDSKKSLDFVYKKFDINSEVELSLKPSEEILEFLNDEFI